MGPDRNDRPRRRKRDPQTGTAPPESPEESAEERASRARVEEILKEILRETEGSTAGASDTSKSLAGSPEGSDIGPAVHPIDPGKAAGDLAEHSPLPPHGLEPAPEIGPSAGPGLEPMFKAAQGPGPKRNGTERAMGPGQFAPYGRTSSMQPRHERSPVKSRSRRKTLTVAVVFAAFVGSLLTILVVGFQPIPAHPVRLDGDLSEWDPGSKHRDGAGDAPPSIDIERFDVHRSRDRMFAMVSFASPGFGSNEAVGVYLLLDSDDRPGTGFAHSGIGADHLAAAIFGNGRRLSGTTYEFQGDDLGNWSGFNGIGEVDGALGTDSVEIGFSLDSLGATWKAALVVQDTSHESDQGDFVIASALPSLRVALSPGAEVLTGIGPVAARLELSASSADVVVGSVDLGNAPVEPVAVPFSITAGTTKTVELRLKAGAVVAAGTVEVELLGVGSSGFATLDSLRNRVRSYYSSAPTKIRIDGAFADWNNASGSPDHPAEGLPERLEITETRGANGTELGGPAFLVSTSGVVMAGDPLPTRTAKPAPGPGGGPVVRPRIDGKDSLSLYLDIGPSLSTGQRIGGIGADYQITAQGIDGRVDSSRLLRWSGTDWSASGDVPAVALGNSIEIAVSKGLIDWGAGADIRSYVELRGWDGTRDVSGGPSVLDPVVLTQGGELYSTIGGGYTLQLTLPAGTWIELRHDSAGRLYALRNDGLVHQVTVGAPWITQAWVAATGGTDFAAFAVSDAASPTVYTIRNNNVGASTARTFCRVTVAAPPGAWSCPSSVTVFTNGNTIGAMAFAGMRGGTGVLYTTVANANLRLRQSTDDGTTWVIGPGGNVQAASVAVDFDGGGAGVDRIYGFLAGARPRFSEFDPATNTYQSAWANYGPADAIPWQDAVYNPTDGLVYALVATGEIRTCNGVPASCGAWTVLEPATLAGAISLTPIPESSPTAAALAISAVLIIAAGGRARRPPNPARRERAAVRSSRPSSIPSRIG